MDDKKKLFRVWAFMTFGVSWGKTNQCMFCKALQSGVTKQRQKQTQSSVTKQRQSGVTKQERGRGERRAMKSFFCTHSLILPLPSPHNSPKCNQVCAFLFLFTSLSVHLIPLFLSLSFFHSLYKMMLVGDFSFFVSSFVFLFLFLFLCLFPGCYISIRGRLMGTAKKKMIRASRNSTYFACKHLMHLSTGSSTARVQDKGK
jgi:hypothetical protein